MRRVSVAPYEGWHYLEMFKITEWKDGCIYKTKSIGYIRLSDYNLLDHKEYTASSCTTDFLKDGGWIDVFTTEEVAAIGRGDYEP